MPSDVIEVNEYEAEAITIIKDILSERGSFHLERRAQRYLTLAIGGNDFYRGYDFCRIKTSERVCWMSIDMWCCSDEIRSDKRLDGVNNKNQRHWKIYLTDNYDIRNYADILIAAYEGSSVRMVTDNSAQVNECQDNKSPERDELNYRIIGSSDSGSQKGRNLFEFVDDYTVIDLETTGFSPSDDEIIEFAGIKVKFGTVVDTYQTLIKPSMEIDDYISHITGITNEMVSDAPTLADVLPKILSFIGGDIIVGHNVSFDISFLRDNCERLLSHVFRNDYLDVMRISRMLLPDMKHHRLKDVAKRLEVTSKPSHRAMADTEATLECYQKLRLIYNDGKYARLPRIRTANGFDAKDITPETNVFDESNPLFEKYVVFTGKLELHTRAEAAQIVANLGGICENTVTKNTDYLVIGDMDYTGNVVGEKSSKLIKAEAYIAKGRNISIISETTFYKMIGEIKE